MAPDVVWEVPGRSPLAGPLVGADAVVDRWRRVQAAVAGVGGRPPRTVALHRSETGAAIGQRNDFLVGETWREVTAVTLLDVADDRLVRMETLVSDQYLIDEYWARLDIG